MEVKQVQTQFTIDWIDLGKSLLLAGLAAFIVSIYDPIQEWLSTDTFAFDKASLVVAIKSGIAGMIAYLIRTYFKPTQTIIKGDVSGKVELMNKYPTAPPIDTSTEHKEAKN